jgi:hypothetical protein
MARIFTINFEFRGADHAAVVSTWKEEAGNELYQVSLYDDELHHLVPDGIVRFSAREESIAPAIDATRLELVHCLRIAVKGYLQKLSV